MTRPPAALLLALLALTLPACGTRPDQPFENLGDTVRLFNPFAPASLLIHPLTRVDRDDAGRPLIVCHIELKDEWGDSCKGRGPLRVELYRASSGAAPGVQELKWEVDLRNLERNTALYDPATRTYRLPLEGAPAWVLDGNLRLRAAITADGPTGEARLLSDDYTIE